MYSSTRFGFYIHFSAQSLAVRVHITLKCKIDVGWCNFFSGQSLVWLQRAKVAASLRRVLFPWETEWDSFKRRPDQSRPGRAGPGQGRQALDCFLCSEGWLAFCQGWQSQSEEVVNAGVQGSLWRGGIDVQRRIWSEKNLRIELCMDSSSLINDWYKTLGFGLGLWAFFGFWSGACKNI